MLRNTTAIVPCAQSFRTLVELVCAFKCSLDFWALIFVFPSCLRRQRKAHTRLPWCYAGLLWKGVWVATRVLRLGKSRWLAVIRVQITFHKIRHACLSLSSFVRANYSLFVLSNCHHTQYNDLCRSTTRSPFSKIVLAVDVTANPPPTTIFQSERDDIVTQMSTKQASASWRNIFREAIESLIRWSSSVASVYCCWCFCQTTADSHTVRELETRTA